MMMKTKQIVIILTKRFRVQRDKFLPLMQRLVVFLRQLLHFHYLLLILQILQPLPLLYHLPLSYPQQ